jgi:hypothetical protein
VSKLSDLLAIPVGLFIVKQITDRIDKEPTTPIPDKPLIKNGFETGPAGPDIRDFNLLPKIKDLSVTETQLASFDPTRQAEIIPYNPGALVAQPIRQGKVIPLGFREGETTEDLLRRLFRN